MKRCLGDNAWYRPVKYGLWKIMLPEVPGAETKNGKQTNRTLSVDQYFDQAVSAALKEITLLH
jgi:hypothetical protein